MAASAPPPLPSVGWRYGFRWCESSGGRCFSSFCLHEDVCAHVAQGSLDPHVMKAETVLMAAALNETLRARKTKTIRRDSALILSTLVTKSSGVFTEEEKLRIAEALETIVEAE